MHPDLSILHSPYTLYKNKKHRLLISFSISAFVWFFLFVFGVFGFDCFKAFKRLYITGLYSLSCWLTLIINFFIVQNLVIRKLTLGSTILFSCWLMCSIAISNFVLTSLVFHWEAFNVRVLLKNQLYTFSLGLIIAPFCILGHYSYLLKKGSEKAIRLGEKTGNKSFLPQEGARVLLESEYKSSNLELDIMAILYMRSADNYISVYYLDDKIVKQRMIRNTLTAVENNPDCRELIRCHRSFMVNLHRIKAIRRTTSGYELVLSETEFAVPVSRKYKEILLSVRNNLSR